MRRTSTLIAELKACRNTKDIRRGRRLHETAIQNGDFLDVFVASTLVDMYAKCGCIVEAHRVFDRMNYRDVVSWNALMMGYADNGQGKTALALLSRMKVSTSPDALSYVAALKACSGLAESEEGTLIDGKLVKVECKSTGVSLHSEISKCCLESHIFVANCLVNMYAKCGCIDLAREVFERIQRRDIVSWNTMIIGYAADGEGALALDMFLRMEREGCIPNARTFVAAVKACSDTALKEECNAKFLKVKSLEKLKFIHSQAVRCGFHYGSHVLSSIVDLYAKCGSLSDARNAIEEAQTPHIVPWNALLFGYIDNGEYGMAIQLFERLLLEGCDPNALTFVAVIKACCSLASKEALVKGIGFHFHASGCGYDTDIRVGNSLMDMYKKNGDLNMARRVFDIMNNHDVISWTSLILGYVGDGKNVEAMELIARMEREGCPPDTVFLNALITCFAENGEGDMALELFSRMEQRGLSRNVFSFVAALKACIAIADKEEASDVGGKLGAREEGVRIHHKAVQCNYDSHVFVASVLVDMYAKCGCIYDARKVFDSMKAHDVVSWTSMILGYADQGEGEISLELFVRMKNEGCEPDATTYVAALKACADMAAKEEAQSVDERVLKVESLARGSAIHAQATKSGADTQSHVASTLVHMYGKCGSMVNAQKAFDSIKEPSPVCWTALVFGYVDNKEERRALDLFSSMKREYYMANALIYAAVLRACGVLGELETGKALHVEICSCGFEKHELVLGSLVYFYGKCGSMLEAQRVFEDTMVKKSLVAWNALLMGYARIGDTKSVFHLFDKLCNYSNLRPDCVTFLTLLSCCSHAGLVDSAQGYFREMSSKFGVVPEVDHYTCMVDLLGRANRLEEAMVLVRTMPFTPDEVTWTTVLGACRKWQREELGKLAFETLMRLDVKDSGAFALMSNMERSRSRIHRIP